MADVVFFHHVLGVTAGCREFACDLEDAGHQVQIPDLFDGAVFTTLDDGLAYAERIGFDTIVDRGCDAVAQRSGRLVFIGMSMGVMSAQRLAQTRDDAAGAVLLEACLPADHFAPRWPPAVPVQIHGMDADSFFAGEGDLDAARALVDRAPPGVAELFVYPGDAHLFMDSSTERYDAHAASLVLDRVLDFLGRLDHLDHLDRPRA